MIDVEKCYLTVLFAQHEANCLNKLGTLHTPWEVEQFGLQVVGETYWVTFPKVVDLEVCFEHLQNFVDLF